MNKIPTIILVLLLSMTITACSSEGSKGNEIEEKEIHEESSLDLMPLDKFIEKYNDLASLTDELKPLSTDEPVENNTQILLNDDSYAVLAIFDEEDDAIFYSVGLTREDPYEELKGSGLYATLNVAATLDLDREKMTEEFEVALKKDAHTYFSDGHMIMFENHKKSSKSGLGMLIQIMKSVEGE